MYRGKKNLPFRFKQMNTCGAMSGKDGYMKPATHCGQDFGDGGN
jgi:hypothetical protein